MDLSVLTSYMDRLTALFAPGNVISVYKNGENVLQYASGYADIEKRIPMTGNELFNIYSCSKVATVVSALQLYEKGLFLLDDPLYEFLPAWKDATVREQDGTVRPVATPVTLRHLFTMTAGLAYNKDIPAMKRAFDETNGHMNTVAVASRLAEEPLLFDPGTHWNYSLCHDVLAAVVEVVSGKRFRDYVRDNLFLPLGITTGRYHADAENARNMAKQYTLVTESATIPALYTPGMPRFGSLIPVTGDNAYRFGDEYDSGGAGILISVPDYARFAAALANYGLGLTGERILAPGTVELLASPQLTPAQKNDFNWSQLTGYSYGLGVRTLVDRGLAGFNGPDGAMEFGWGGAAGATFICDPKSGIACFYAHHMLNQQEAYYQPRLRNALFTALA